MSPGCRSLVRPAARTGSAVAPAMRTSGTSMAQPGRAAAKEIQADAWAHGRRRMPLVSPSRPGRPGTCPSRTATPTTRQARGWRRRTCEPGHFGRYHGQRGAETGAGEDGRKLSRAAGMDHLGIHCDRGVCGMSGGFVDAAVLEGCKGNAIHACRASRGCCISRADSHVVGSVRRHADRLAAGCPSLQKRCCGLDALRPVAVSCRPGRRRTRPSCGRPGDRTNAALVRCRRDGGGTGPSGSCSGG